MVPGPLRRPVPASGRSLLESRWHASRAAFVECFLSDARRGASARRARRPRRAVASRGRPPSPTRAPGDRHANAARRGGSVARGRGGVRCEVLFVDEFLATFAFPDEIQTVVAADTATTWRALMDADLPGVAQVRPQ